ncbi:sensor histidine kinase [Streptomyces sp. WMMC500]|uniref:sensor histidine kinase n=1 Tax=Streptomyces sp. WMMC500 TaxID=3015154 RepID=UPI00248C7ED5|nr:sensor histidine kinase [Streptomyces sp. WMMC500]WBB61569.1 sensor histidine kinase [Streptomyces sp. WMMC500]
MKINRRLVLLVAVPLAVAIAFSVRALAPATSQAFQANRLAQMVDAAESAAELTARLQHERVAATALVAAQGDATTFRKAADATDAGISDYTEKRRKLSSLPHNADLALQRIDRSLAELPSLRAQARSGGGTLSALAFGYRITIADLIDYRDGIAQADGVDADIADRIRASASLSRAAEHVAQQQVVVLRALAGGGFTPASQRTFDATRLGYTEATGVFFTLGPGEWRSWLERTLAGPRALPAQRMEDEVGRTTVGQDLDVSAAEWQEATADRLSMLRSVESRVDDAVHDSVKEERSTLIWWAVIEIIVVILTLIGALLFAFRIGRVMIRRLRDLRNAAHTVATERLPQIVTDLSQPGALGGATPQQVADSSGSPVETTGEDEIGEVGEAFNSVHHEAVRLAAQQAHAHEQFAETLVGVARRGAQLTSVMVSELDAVQRDEADPERMKILFALDHLAIRMERNTNNLLVMGGYGHARVREADAPCATVVVAAAQQIERFERVAMGIVEQGIGIAARAVHDLAHILAELLDNATRFSPPDKQVGVAVWRLWDRAVVQIVDEGVGMTPERRDELNARLANPQTGVGAVRSMGLHVVARLAGRHGIVVELRSSAGPGTIAEVTLPPSVLVAVEEETMVEGERPLVEGEASVFGGSPRGVPGPRKPMDEPAAAAAPRRGQAAAGSAGTRDAQQAGTRNGSGTRRNPPFGPEYDPADRVAGVSPSGLPVRMRQPADQWPRFPKRDGERPGRSERKPAPAKRRDSRQISDVLAAYTQGISRSTGRREGAGGAADRGRPAGAGGRGGNGDGRPRDDGGSARTARKSGRTRTANDDDSQRST